MFDGGQKIVDRLLKAYGYTTQRELVDKIGVGQGTVSTWIRRNYFPGEAVVQCALDTGASLKWLATGEGQTWEGAKEAATETKNKLMALDYHVLHDGHLVAGEQVLCDSMLLPTAMENLSVIASKQDNKNYLVEKKNIKNSDGLWLVQKADVITIENIQRVPGNCWRIENIDWPVDEVSLLGKVIGSIAITI